MKKSMRKILSLLLFTTLIISVMLANSTAYAQEVREEWDGSVALEGTDYIVNGTEYEIYTPLGLAYIAYMQNNDAENFSAGKSFKLMADLDIGEKDWLPIGVDNSLNKQFKGVFDFNGYKVLNMTRTLDYTYYDGATSYFGLIGCSTGKIINPYLTVGDVILSSPRNVYYGGLVGQSNGLIGSETGNADITVILEGDFIINVTGQARMGIIAGQLMGAGFVIGTAGNGDVNINVEIAEDAELTAVATMHCFIGGVAGCLADADGIVGSRGTGSVNIQLHQFGKIKATTNAYDMNVGGMFGNIYTNAKVGNAYDGVSGDVKISSVMYENALIYAKSNVSGNLVRIGGIFSQVGGSVGIISANNTADIEFLFTCLSEGEGTGFYTSGGNLASSGIGGIVGVSQGKDKPFGTRGEGYAGFASILSSTQIDSGNALLGNIAGTNAGAFFGASTLNSGKGIVRAYGDNAIKVFGNNGPNYVQPMNRIKVVTTNNSLNCKLMLENINFPAAGNANTGTIDIGVKTPDGYTLTGWKEDGNSISVNIAQGAIYRYSSFSHIIDATTGDYVWTVEPVISVLNGYISASYVQNKLTVAVKNPLNNYSYQYWIKKYVTTDGATNINAVRPIWQLTGSYEKNRYVKEITVNEDYIINGVYEVIVRVKNSSGVFEGEMYGKFSLSDLNIVKINSVSIDNISYKDVYFADKAAGQIEVKAYSEASENVSYTLYNGEEVVTQNSTGIFTVDISGYANGSYEFKVTADNGADYDEYDLKLYVYGDYNSAATPVINNISGTSNANGYTEFTIDISYDSGAEILLSDIDKFDFIFKTGSSQLTFDSYVTNGGYVEAVKYTYSFETNGVYPIRGGVKRDSVSDYDDEINYYYYGHTRSADLTLSSGSFTAAKGGTFAITASGTITNSVNPLEYAYYREDASGWVMIKDYSTNSELAWTPLYSGIYNIQVRVREQGNASYEKTASRIFTVTGEGLLGSLAVYANDYTDGTAITEGFITANPYCITADYSGSENVLYMFTVYNKNTGLIYLNTYTTSNKILFTPKKSDEYTVTARVINLKNFGYKDIDEPLTIVSTVQ